MYKGDDHFYGEGKIPVSEYMKLYYKAVDPIYFTPYIYEISLKIPIELHTSGYVCDLNDSKIHIEKCTHRYWVIRKG